MHAESVERDSIPQSQSQSQSSITGNNLNSLLPNQPQRKLSLPVTEPKQDKNLLKLFKGDIMNTNNFNISPNNTNIKQNPTLLTYPNPNQIISTNEKNNNFLAILNSKQNEDNTQSNSNLNSKDGKNNNNSNGNSLENSNNNNNLTSSGSYLFNP